MRVRRVGKALARAGCSLRPGLLSVSGLRSSLQLFGKTQPLSVLSSASASASAAARQQQRRSFATVFKHSWESELDQIEGLDREMKHHPMAVRQRTDPTWPFIMGESPVSVYSPAGEPPVLELMTPIDSDLYARNSEHVTSRVGPVITDLKDWVVYRPVFRQLDAWLADMGSQKEGLDVRGASICLTGHSGCGKSFSLAWAMNEARKQGYLVISTTGGEARADRKSFVTPSEEREGVYEQPEGVMAYFRDLVAKEAALLAEVPLLYEHDYKYAKELDGRTLLSLAQLGASEAGMTWPSLIRDFVRELRHTDAVKVLVALDDVNRWDLEADYFRLGTPNTMMTRELSLADAFIPFVRDGPKNGITFFAHSYKWSLRGRKQQAREAAFQLYHDMYSDTELWHLLQHYFACQLIVDDRYVDDAQFLGRVKSFCNRNPTAVYEYAQLLQ